MEIPTAEYYCGKGLFFIRGLFRIGYGNTIRIKPIKGGVNTMLPCYLPRSRRSPHQLSRPHMLLIRSTTDWMSYSILRHSTVRFV